MGSENKLELGVLRTGTLYQTDLRSPSTQGILQRLAGALQVTVSWPFPDSPYAGWFMGKAAAGGGAPPREGPPPTMLFRDAYGLLQLVGCWPSAYEANLHGAGSGTIRALYAVMDPEHVVDYRDVNGAESHISGLAAWLEVRSWVQEEVDQDPRRVRFSRTPFPPIQVETSEEIGFSITANAGWQRHEGSVLLEDNALCRTESSVPQPWEKHMDLHEALRELLVLSRWWDESCVPVRTTRQDDPLLALNDAPLGPAWRTVAVPHEDRQPPPKGYVPHLIPFAQIGVAGLKNWFRLRSHYRRALGPVVSSIGLSAVDYSTALAHLGPGIEALASYLLKEDGLSSNNIRHTKLVRQAERIVEEVQDVLPIDGPAWATLFARSYNSVKHVNRDWPSDADMVNSIRGCVLVTRAWVALRLGIARDHARQTLGRDPYASIVVHRE